MFYTIKAPNGDRLRIQGHVPRTGDTISMEGTRGTVIEVIHRPYRCADRSKIGDSEPHVVWEPK